MSETTDIPRTMALAPRSFAEAKDQANALAKAEGFVNPKAFGKPAAVLAALMTGAELGIGPMEALRSIHVIEGKPTLSAEFMLTRAIRSGVKHQWLELSAKVARVKLTRPGWEPMTLSFTTEEAEAAGVTRKDNWRKYPAAMLRARCISAAIRAYCPDVLGANLYTPEEMGAETDETGDPVVVERAPLRAVDAAPRGEPSAASGEAACGGSCGEAPAERAESGPVPKAPEIPKLSECTTNETLGTWLDRAGRRAYALAPGETAKKVRDQARSVAARLGLSDDDAAVYVREALESIGHVEEPAAAE